VLAECDRVVCYCCVIGMYVQSDFDMVEYLNDLRESCLEAYTGIVQGLKGEPGQISGVYSRQHMTTNYWLRFLNLSGKVSWFVAV